MQTFADPDTCQRSVRLYDGFSKNVRPSWPLGIISSVYRAAVNGSTADRLGSVIGGLSQQRNRGCSKSGQVNVAFLFDDWGRKLSLG
jgi:hypothetical protein